MEFSPTKLPGVWLVRLERLKDERGFFARSWCQQEFASRGLNPRVAQCSISFNSRQGTLRGMHYQAPPFEEAKLVRCTRGAVYDVILDIRRKSPTFGQWIAVELREDDLTLVYISEGLAHGFQTLTDNTELFYQISEYYHPESARGVRWNDPLFGIDWPPADQRVISSRDASYEDFPC